MNDIYQEKAKKYKYKYLELKRLKRSIELEGGYWLFDWEWPKWLSTAPVNEKNEQNEQSVNINPERTRFKNLLESLQKKINEELIYLYKDNKILGNIDNKIINNDQIVFDMTKPIYIIPKPENETLGGVTTDEVKNKIKEIVEKYPLYVPPIINCYFELSENSTNSKLFNSFIDCLKKKELSGKKLSENEYIQKIGGIFSNDIETKINQLGTSNTLHYDLFYIYKKIIRNLEKDIDYYALTKVICDEFDKYIIKNPDFNSQGKVVEENSLKELIIILENHFYNNSLTKDIFLQQLDKIIKAI
jgi:hypothetical protein